MLKFKKRKKGKTMPFENKRKKTVLDKPKMSLATLMKYIKRSEYSVDVANRLNEVIKQFGYEEAVKIYKIAKKEKPDVPSVYFSIKEGLFTGYSVNNGNFADFKDFEENIEKYVKLHMNKKEKETERMAVLQRKIKAKNDLVFRFSLIKEISGEKLNEIEISDELRNLVKIYPAVFKVCKDNKYISAVQEVEKYYLAYLTYFHETKNAIASIPVNLEEFEKTRIFPYKFGATFIGRKENPVLTIVANAKELAKYLVSGKNLEQIKKEESFFILNDISKETTIFKPGSKRGLNYYEELFKDDKVLDFLKNKSEAKYYGSTVKEQDFARKIYDKVKRHMEEREPLRLNQRLQSELLL
jgi:hypothetical protein